MVIESVRERSILVVCMAKYGQLREPIRMLLFTMDRFKQVQKPVEKQSQ